MGDQGVGPAVGRTSTGHFLFHLLQWWDLWEESLPPPAVGSWGGIMGMGLIRSVGGANGGGGACKASSRSWVMEAASPRSSSTSSLHTEEKDLQKEQMLEVEVLEF